MADTAFLFVADNKKVIFIFSIFSQLIKNYFFFNFSGKNEKHNSQSKHAKITTVKLIITLILVQYSCSFYLQ